MSNSKVNCYLGLYVNSSQAGVGTPKRASSNCAGPLVGPFRLKQQLLIPPGRMVLGGVSLILKAGPLKPGGLGHQKAGKESVDRSQVVVIRVGRTDRVIPLSAPLECIQCGLIDTWYGSI